MTIEPRNRNDQEVLQQALKRAAGVSLPLTARGLSLEEIEARDARRGRIWVPLLIALVWFLFLPMRETEHGTGSTLAYVIVSLVGSLAVVVGWRWHARHGRRHGAQDADVDVAQDRIIVRSSGGVHEIDYADVEFGLTSEVIGKSGARLFQGIVLETPAGALRLDDRHFESGGDAAAAILRVCNGGDAI